MISDLGRELIRADGQSKLQQGYDTKQYETRCSTNACKSERNGANRWTGKTAARVTTQGDMEKFADIYAELHA